MSSLLMLSALLLGGDPPATAGNAYYVQAPVLQYAGAQAGAYSAFGAYESNSFDGYGWGYPTGNYGGLCPITRRQAQTMGIWDDYCSETATCGCCGHQNGSYSHIMFCKSRQQRHGCGSCGQPANSCGCDGHDHGHAHDHGVPGGVIIEEGHPVDNDTVPPAPATEGSAPAVQSDGVTRIQGGRYDDFLLEPGEDRVPANAPWIRGTNLRTKPMENAEPPMRNWLFPRNDKPELPPIVPPADEKITGSAPAADPFFTGKK